MAGRLLFYVLCIPLSLYALYLFAFKTYNVDYKGRHTERLHCMNAIYLASFIACFIPFLNFVMTVTLLIIGLINHACNDIYIDSWLFRKPGEKKEEEKEIK